MVLVLPVVQTAALVLAGQDIHVRVFGGKNQAGSRQDSELILNLLPVELWSSSGGVQTSLHNKKSSELETRQETPPTPGPVSSVG